MLDLSLPYKEMLFYRKPNQEFSMKDLPEGFRFVSFKQGDEEFLAEIETSVLEFSNKEAALEQFNKIFLPYIGEPERRIFFIETDDGYKVGNIMIWWEYINNKRFPNINWVAIRPEYQGKKLGYPLVAYGLKKAIEIEGDRELLLTTQTNSHKAIKLYLALGFEYDFERVTTNIVGDKTLINRTKIGLEIIKHLL